LDASNAELRKWQARAKEAVDQNREYDELLIARDQQLEMTREELLATAARLKDSIEAGWCAAHRDGAASLHCAQV